MNAITTATAPLAYGDLERLADSIAKSGLFGIKNKDQAISLMMIAHAEGTHPALAARDYDIINGRPAKKAEAMMRDFLKAGGKVEWHTVSDELADATFTHPQTGSVRIDWDMKRAKTAFGAKDMYTKFPRQMLRSRVVSEGVRTLWPLATSGMYVPDEVRDMPPHDGPTREQEAEAEAPSPPLDSLRAVAADVKRERKVAPKVKVYEPTLDLSPLMEPDGPKWLANLEGLMANAQCQQDTIDIGGHESVGNVIAPDSKAPNHIKQHVNKILADGYKRFADPATRETPDDLVIPGEQYAAAGD